MAGSGDAKAMVRDSAVVLFKSDEALCVTTEGGQEWDNDIWIVECPMACGPHEDVNTK